MKMTWWTLYTLQCFLQKGTESLTKPLSKNNKSLYHAAKKKFRIELALSGFDSGFQGELHRTWSLCSWHNSWPCWLKALCSPPTGAAAYEPSFLSAVPVTCHAWALTGSNNHSRDNDCSQGKARLWLAKPFLPAHLWPYYMPPFIQNIDQSLRGDMLYPQHQSTHSTEKHAKDDKGLFSLRFFFFSISIQFCFRLCISFLIPSPSA